jgi:hypothetical protein
MVKHALLISLIPVILQRWGFRQGFSPLFRVSNRPCGLTGAWDTLSWSAVCVVFPGWMGEYGSEVYPEMRGSWQDGKAWSESR